MSKGITDIGIKILVLTALFALLPESPFVAYVHLTEQIPFLNYLNWFLPINEIISLLESYILVVSAYYAVMIGLRYASALKGS